MKVNYFLGHSFFKMPLEDKRRSKETMLSSAPEYCNRKASLCLPEITSLNPSDAMAIRGCESKRKKWQ